MSLLEARDLVKVYPGGKRAVDGVDIHVEPGEIVGLLGPNGAGKTTTFRMCCGLVAPTEGRVQLRGKEVTRWPMYKRARLGMGFLPQETSIFVQLSVEQNILAVLEFLKVKRTERLRRTDELLHKFGLADKRRQISRSLSGGEKRRLEIARCLASDPALILLDEPFTGIDPVTIHGIQDIIAGLRDEGISILLTDHRERETLTITDRSYIICAGRVLVAGDAQTVLEDPTAQEMYFGKRFDGRSIIEGKQAFTESAAEQAIERATAGARRAEAAAAPIPPPLETSQPLPKPSETGLPEALVDSVVAVAPIETPVPAASPAAAAPSEPESRSTVPVAMPDVAPLPAVPNDPAKAVESTQETPEPTTATPSVPTPAASVEPAPREERRAA
jgi:lipopolysaccharide export system ATP-binding protein